MVNSSNTLRFTQFTHRILIHPLGLLYGSKGRFLSPENLVGRSGFHFPPDTPTLSGIYAAQYGDQPDILGSLLLAGPFWAKTNEPDNIYVPTPLHAWVRDHHIRHRLVWRDDRWQPESFVNDQDKDYKHRQWDTWIGLKDWATLRSPQPFDPIPVQEAPWKPVPHLHPRLREEERRSVGSNGDRGSLFLEYGIQLDPEVCLVYLSNTPLPENSVHRFGGEGHMVQVTSKEIKPNEPIRTLLDEPVGDRFSLVCPGVWGSNRLSYRAPCRHKDTGSLSWPDGNAVQALLTQRPRPFRFRMGNQKDETGNDTHQKNQPKLLSRGRYAVPSGSVYVMERSLPPWLQWPDGSWPEQGWFPTEGYSFKRWGCGLALPLSGALP